MNHEAEKLQEVIEQSFLSAEEKTLLGDLLKQEGPPIPAKPEQVWYRKAIKTEYDFCIHEKGL